MSDRILDAAVVRATYATAATYKQSPDPARVAAFDHWLAGVTVKSRGTTRTRPRRTDEGSHQEVR